MFGFKSFKLQIEAKNEVSFFVFPIDGWQKCEPFCVIWTIRFNLDELSSHFTFLSAVYVLNNIIKTVPKVWINHEKSLISHY